MYSRPEHEAPNVNEDCQHCSCSRLANRSVEPSCKRCACTLGARAVTAVMSPCRSGHNFAEKFRPRCSELVEVSHDRGLQCAPCTTVHMQERANVSAGD